MQEISVKTLLQRINAAKNDVDYIKKDKDVETGNCSYKAVTHDMVTAMTRKSLITHGIVSWPVLVESSMIPPLSDVKKQWRYEATYDFIFANCDDANDKIVIRIEAHAMDNADKAPGKALSYAKKYAILKLLDIETGEDEESRFIDFEEEAAKYVADMNNAKDLAELQTVFRLAHTSSNDKSFRSIITAAKDKRKKELSDGSENT